MSRDNLSAKDTLYYIYIIITGITVITVLPLSQTIVHNVDKIKFINLSDSN